MNGTEFWSYQFPSGSISSERHPTDNLVDNPTVVFFSFIFLLRFFFFLNTEERDLLREQNMKFPLSIMGGDKTIHSVVSVSLSFGAFFSNSVWNIFDFELHWRRKWQPTPVLLPGESHGWRSLVGYSPWGRKEFDMTERLPHCRRGIIFHCSITESFSCYLLWTVKLST